MADRARHAGHIRTRRRAGGRPRRLRGRCPPAPTARCHAPYPLPCRVQSVPERPNVELRRTTEHGEIVVLSFPYDVHIVGAVRGIPQRRFDWDRRSGGRRSTTGARCTSPTCSTASRTSIPTDEVATWLEGVDRRWVGSVERHPARRPRLVGHAHARGAAPAGARRRRRRARRPRRCVPMTAEHADALRELSSARIDARRRALHHALRARRARRRPRGWRSSSASAAGG